MIARPAGITERGPTTSSMRRASGTGWRKERSRRRRQSRRLKIVAEFAAGEVVGTTYHVGEAEGAS